MTQSAGRPTTNIQQGSSAMPGRTTAEASRFAEAPRKPAGMSWGWRVALFLWASTFICLLAYELLNTLVRSLARLF